MIGAAPADWQTLAKPTKTMMEIRMRFTIHFYNHFLKLTFHPMKALMHYFACPKSPYGTISGHYRTLYPLVNLVFCQLYLTKNICSNVIPCSYRLSNTTEGFCCLCSQSLAKLLQARGTFIKWHASRYRKHIQNSPRRQLAGTLRR